MKADLVISNIGQLVTCASGGKPKRGAEMLDVGLIENGAIAVEGGKIVGIGATDKIKAEFQSEQLIDAQGKVVCPGFVDPHTHIVFAGDRLDEFELKIQGADYLEILSKGGGILSTVCATREASFEQLVETGRMRLDKMLACGTTTCEIKTGYGLDINTEMKMLGVIAELDATHTIDIVPTFLPAHAIPSEFTNNAGRYVDLICNEMLPRAWHWYVGSRFFGRVPFFVDVFCETNAFNLDQSRRILESARSMGFRVKAHTDEFTNLGGSRLGIALGATSIDHLDTISEDEVKLLAASNTIGIVTPAVNLNFGSCRYANARMMIDEGCAVALATDYNPGSAPCPSQRMSMAIACRYQKLLPSEALNAATINAAFASGLGGAAGSIEVGKRADLLIANCEDHRALAYEFGNGGMAWKVVKGGGVAEFCK